jgi:hypothetical protein
MNQSSSSLGHHQREEQSIIDDRISDFSLKNKLLFECLFCKETFAKILSYLNHISKHEMKQIHKCTICKKIVVEDKHFHDHLLEKHSELVDIRVIKKPSKVEVNNNREMDNFYHQLPYSYYQQFPQITTPILSNYIPAIQQAQNNGNNSNVAMGMPCRTTLWVYICTKNVFSLISTKQASAAAPAAAAATAKSTAYSVGGLLKSQAGSHWDRRQSIQMPRLQWAARVTW